MERSIASEVDKLYVELGKPTAPPEPEIIAPKITLQPTRQELQPVEWRHSQLRQLGSLEPSFFTWQRQDNRKWKDISGAAEATFTIDAASLEDSTNYRVVVSNSAGSVNSKTAKLSVLDPPSFVEQPQDMLFATGGNATLEVTVTGSKTLRYKWFKDGSEIPKATKNRLTLKKATAARNDGTYQVERLVRWGNHY